MTQKRLIYTERVHKRDIVLAAAVGLLIIVFLWGMIPLVGVQKGVVQYLRLSGADSCAIGGIALTPRLSVEIKNIYYRSKTGNVETIIEIPRTVVSVRVLRVATDLVRRKAAVVPVLFDAGKSPLLPRQQRALDSLLFFASRFQVKKIQCDRVRFSTRLPIGTQVQTQSATITLQTSFNQTVKMKGDITAATVAFDKTLLHDIRCPVTLEDGVLKINHISAEGYGGDFFARGRVDLRRMRLLQGELKVKKFNVERWYDSAGVGGGTLQGHAEGSFDLQPSDLVFDSLRGTGSLLVTKLTAEKLPAQRDLMVLIVLPQLAKIQFKKISAKLRLAGGRLYTDPILGISNELELQGVGYVTLRGIGNEQIKIILSAETMRDVAPLLRKSLDIEPDGRYSFKCRLSGALSSPKLEVDEKIMNRAVNNVFEGLQRGFKDLFN